MPQNVPLGLRLLYETVDGIWYAVGDQATDFSFYTKRASLAELESQFTQAKLQADRDLELTRLNLKSDLESRLSVDQAQQLQKRVELQKQRLKFR